MLSRGGVISELEVNGLWWRYGICIGEPCTTGLPLRGPEDDGPPYFQGELSGEFEASA